MFTIKETGDNTWSIFHGEKVIARAWSVGFSFSTNNHKIRVNTHKHSFLMFIPEMNKDSVLATFSDMIKN